jgi:hypothetical protein
MFFCAYSFKNTYPLKKPNKYLNYLLFVGNLRVKDVCVVACVQLFGANAKKVAKIVNNMNKMIIFVQ